MARVIIVTNLIALENQVFSSVKKVCEAYKLNYREVGDKLREGEIWSNDQIRISRSKIK